MTLVKKALSLQYHYTFMLVDSRWTPRWKCLKNFAKIVLCKAINAPTEHIMSHKYRSMSVNRLMNMDYKWTGWYLFFFSRLWSSIFSILTELLPQARRLSPQELQLSFTLPTQTMGAKVISAFWHCSFSFKYVQALTTQRPMSAPRDIALHHL